MHNQPLSETNKFLNEECFRRALYNFGTAYIFQQRATYYRSRLQVLNFLGIVVPATLGVLVAAIGVSSPLIPFFIAFTTIASTGQLIGSIWSLAFGWQDSLTYASKSISANNYLHLRYIALNNLLAAGQDIDRREYAVLEVDYLRQMNEDDIHGLTESEKRMGLRAALRNAQKACVACGQIPNSMDASECDVCGRF